MKTSTIILFLIILFAFLCCSYDEPEKPDAIPPSKVHLIKHKSDNIDSLALYTDIDLNNGIDAEQSGNPDYNWMKIQWGDELKKDPDIHHIDIYRYNNEDTTKVMVDGIIYQPDSTQFVDTFESVETIIQQTWFYFIIPYDEAGNFTVSDTVSYRLIEKPGLEFPPDGSTFSVGDSVGFFWSGLDYLYRILFFDESHCLQFAKDLEQITQEGQCTLSEIGFSPISGITYIWRIDAFGMGGGSESEERKITFN
jgi:hypothetical protein